MNGRGSDMAVLTGDDPEPRATRWPRLLRTSELANPGR